MTGKQKQDANLRKRDKIMQKQIIKREKRYLKIVARTKVKAGERLLMAEASVGEVYSIPLNPVITHAYLPPPQTLTIKFKFKNP